MPMRFDWLQAEVKRGRSLWPQKPEILSHGQDELWQYRVKWAGKDKAGKGGRRAYEAGQGIMGRKSGIHLLALRASDHLSPRLQSARKFKIIQIANKILHLETAFLHDLVFSSASDGDNSCNYASLQSETIKQRDK